ncbi:MAG: hypothetical protein IPJ79_01335 [Bacteroidetes bacterium]|nr:hypothetical protein [Bacteroidota bacterium]
MLEVFIRKILVKLFSLGAKALLIWLKLTLFPLLITAAYLLYMRYKNPAVWHESPPVFTYQNFIRLWVHFMVFVFYCLFDRCYKAAHGNAQSSDILRKSSAYGGDYHPWLLETWTPNNRGENLKRILSQ